MTKESFTINGENLMKKIKELIAEGNVSRITVTNKAGKEVLNLPLMYGVVGVLVMPVLLAVGAMATVFGECTIAIEREEFEHEQAAQ